MNPSVTRLEGQYHAEGAKIALVCSRFNDFIVKRLEEGAIDTLVRHGICAENLTIAYVPGAHELPLIAQRLAATGHYDAIIALGAVIKGGTAHFDVVVNEQAKGLGAVALKYDIPVITGVLTTNNIEQAVERAGTKAGNKGSEAALAAIEMISLLRQIK